MWDYSTVLYLYNLHTIHIHIIHTYIYIHKNSVSSYWILSQLQTSTRPTIPNLTPLQAAATNRTPHFGGATRKRGQHQTGVPPHGKATRLVHPVVSRIVKTCPRQNHYPHLKNKFCGWLSRIQKDLRGSKRQWGTIILFYELVLKRCPFS